MRIAHVGAMRPVGSFADIQSVIHDSLAPINRAISNEPSVGVSLRLSQSALSDESTTAENLRVVLGDHGLKLIGIAGVAIGGGAKADVHRPDWRTEERLAYMFPATNLAAEFATPEQEVGVTTNALSSRNWIDVDMPGNWTALTLNMIRVVQHLVGIHNRTGVIVHIDIEPEPGSVLRDTSDVVKFFSQWLVPRGSAMLSDRMSLEGSSAAELITRHVRVVLDTAHAAVVWDDPAASLDAFAEHGIRIGRVQASSALEIEVPADDMAQQDLSDQLGALASPILLQQVVASRGGEIVKRFDDLPGAIAVMSQSAGDTWRIHTHAPLLADRYGGYGSTRADTGKWLSEIASRGLEVGMIELRSANWDVVPHDDRAPLESMIMREAAWVRGFFESRS